MQTYTSTLHRLQCCCSITCSWKEGSKISLSCGPFINFFLTSGSAESMVAAMTLVVTWTRRASPGIYTIAEELETVH